jgi:hypothetical protein
MNDDGRRSTGALINHVATGPPEGEIRARGLRPLAAEGEWLFTTPIFGGLTVEAWAFGGIPFGGTPFGEIPFGGREETFATWGFGAAARAGAETADGGRFASGCFPFGPELLGLGA